MNRNNGTNYHLGSNEPKQVGNPDKDRNINDVTKKLDNTLENLNKFIC